jgi:nucleoside-diphosphate-sugar epimerase
MRIFLAGASGVIGVRLVPLLVAAGHEVAGMTRSPTKADLLRDLGAEPVHCDVYDLDKLRKAVVAFGPQTVMHQLTDLPDDAVEIPQYMPANSRIRREGTRNLLAAAQTAGATRFIAQSVAFPLPGDAGAAVEEHEAMVLDAGGVVIRYGQFYGPGTFYETEKPSPPRIQIDAAARRTMPTLDAPNGVLTVEEG